MSRDIYGYGPNEVSHDIYGYGPNEVSHDHDGPDHGPANGHDGPDHGPANGHDGPDHGPANGHDGPDHGPANGHVGPDEADHGPAPLPTVWNSAEHADWLYDALSDALRDHADVFPDTDAAFTALDQWLRDGGTLPGPWRNAARPGDEADD